MNAVNQYEQRLTMVREAMRAHKVDGLVLTNHEKKKVDIQYLTGFTGSWADCVISGDRQVFITDERYKLQAPEEVAPNWEIRILYSGLDYIPPIVRELGISKLGLLEDEESWKFQRGLSKKVRPCKLVPLPNILRKIRAVKDESEIAAIRKAIKVTEQALEYMYTLVRAGVSDRFLATRFKVKLLEMGVEISFDPIIISGPHSAMVHGDPFKLPDRKIERGDIIQFDVGCVVDGYVSDISRIVVCGKATDEQKRMHHAVLEAIKESLKLYRPGFNGYDACMRANEVIRSHRYPELPHGLGHGIGLEVHELPWVSKAKHMAGVFEVGNVVTNEPGIYLEGCGGMRVEEDILITPSGPERLTQLTTELLEL